MSENPSLSHNAGQKSGMASKKTVKSALIFLFILVIGVPLGLLAVGTAYGEWGSDQLLEEIGYVPSGVEEGENFWNSPFPDYGFGGLDPNLAYWLSAIIGSLIVVGVILLIGKFFKRKEARSDATA